MPDILIVTREEVLEWFHSQPADRTINMAGPSEALAARLKPACGCLLLQFAEDKGIDANSVGISVWCKRAERGNSRNYRGTPVAQLEPRVSLYDFFHSTPPGGILGYKGTFGDLKQYIKDHNA